MTQPPLRVAIWCAVSSKAQAEPDKISLQAQEDAGRQFAAALEATVVRVYTVPGHSRDLIFWSDAEAAIPAYRQLREDVAAGVFDILHVLDPDRLGRDPALSNQVLSLVEKNGGEVYFASAPHVIGQKGTGARYVFAIQSTRAGEEQRRRVQHHKIGMSKRQRRGLHPNTWPYGYTPTRDASGQVTGAQLHPQQAAAIRLATALFLEGLPYAQIARQLQENAHPPPRAAHRRWDRTTVKRIFLNPAYAGRVQWSGQPADEKSDLFPALWDDATYAAVRRELEYRRRNTGRRTTSTFGRIAYCARCGRPMYRTTTGHPLPDGSRIPALECSTRRRRGECHRNITREDALRDALTAYLQHILDDRAFDDALAGAATPEDDLRARLQGIDARRDDLDRQRQRLALALAAGLMDPHVYRQADDTLLADLTTLNEKRAQTLDALAAIPDAQTRRHTLLTLRDQLPTLWALPPAHINALLRQAGIRILCENGHPTAITLT